MQLRFRRPGVRPRATRRTYCPAAGAKNVDFPLLQRIALPVAIGSGRYPGIKIHDTRVIRLCEVMRTIAARAIRCPPQA
jgi:hypothetical protein